MRAIYGLTWKELEEMPYGELHEHLAQLGNMHRLLTSVEVVTRGD